MGIYYYRARYYSPAIGRFLQTDPIGYGDGLNWYAYVGNDPMNKTDPSGNNSAVARGTVAACGGPARGTACAMAVGATAIILSPIATRNRQEAANNFIRSLSDLSPITNNNEANEPPKTSSPDAPGDLVSDDNRPTKGRVNSGPLSEGNGGTGNAGEDFDTLTGGIAVLRQKILLYRKGV